VPGRTEQVGHQVAVKGDASIATVVAALRDRVSSVMSCSADRTVVSLIVRIRVVLPAENGPVTTIFTAVPPCLRRPGVRLVSRVIRSEPPDADDQPQQQRLVQMRIDVDLR